MAREDLTQDLVDELNIEIRQLKLILSRNAAAIVKLQRQMDSIEDTLKPKRCMKAKKQ